MGAPMLGYAERDLDDFPGEPHVQSDDKVSSALASWEATQEPWHLEPPREDTKAEDYAHIVRECQEFIGRWGASALMRCVGEALK